MAGLSALLMKNTMKPDLQAPSTLPLRRRVCSAAALLALAAGLAACGDAKSPAGAANGAGAGAPPRIRALIRSSGRGA